jgi:hypothetical protein
MDSGFMRETVLRDSGWMKETVFRAPMLVGERVKTVKTVGKILDLKD